jgi:hypothetical protein
MTWKPSMRVERPCIKPLTWRYLVALFIGIFPFFIASPPAASAANSKTDNLGATQRYSSTELIGGWHFVRTRNPQGGADAMSIMHTADTSRSDLDLAGLMIRCREGATEAVIVVLRPYPLRARPHVVFGSPGNDTNFEATIAAPGTAILIPRNAATLVRGPWRGLKELPIRVDDGQSTIRGVVAIAGLQAAFKLLMASCPAQ